jgi:CRP/FNR family transcriptional regulator, cyclic AMP receptor protein
VKIRTILPEKRQVEVDEMEEDKEIHDSLLEIPLFSSLIPKHFERVTKLAHHRNVKPGEVIFREGDKQDFIYIVLDGRISLEFFVPHHGKMRFYTVEPYDVFGWSSVMPEIHQRTAGAVAVLASQLLCFNAERICQFAEEDHQFGYLLMSQLTNIIASRLMVTRLQLIDMFAKPSELMND